MLNQGTSAAQQNRVVLNCTLDVGTLGSRKTVDLSKRIGYERAYANTSLEDHYLGALPGEILFMNVNQPMGKRKQVRDTYLSVFSSLNGMLSKRGQSLDEMSNDLHFVGFAETVGEFESNKMRIVDMVSNVGGTRTIRNTGQQHIRAGDWLYWSLPDPSNVKTNSKIVAEINPMRLSMDYRVKEVKNRLSAGDEDDYLTSGALKIIKATKSLDGKTDAEQRDVYAKLLSSLFNDNFLPELEHIRSRVVGRALSNAKPGSELDILMGAYCV